MPSFQFHPEIIRLTCSGYNRKSSAKVGAVGSYNSEVEEIQTRSLHLQEAFVQSAQAASKLTKSLLFQAQQGSIPHSVFQILSLHYNSTSQHNYATFIYLLPPIGLDNLQPSQKQRKNLHEQS